MKAFVDANVFLRFLRADDAQQAKAAAALFEAARARGVELLTGPPVLFEVAWTLRSVYGCSRAEVLGILESLVAMPGLRLTDRDLVGGALKLARDHGMEFADAYIAASTLDAEIKLATFNVKDFKACGVPLRPWAA